MQIYGQVFAHERQFCVEIQVFSSKTQQTSIQFVQKLKYFLKTQGKYSFFRQVHYPALPKLGRKEKPELSIQCAFSQAVFTFDHSVQN